MAFNSTYPINLAIGLGVVVWVLVSITIGSLFTYDHVFSSGVGSSLCMPGLSIRCEPDDCGSLYVRCGRNQKRQEVPGNKVCYKGALISVNSRMHSSGLLPHTCRERTLYSRNSTKKFDLRACDCQTQCSGLRVCVCYCQSGKQTPTTCQNSGAQFRNPDQATCCQKTCKLSKQGEDSEVSWTSISRYLSLWTEALDFVRVVIRSAFKQMRDSLRHRFTFPPTMAADACCTRAAGNYCNEC